MPNSAPLPTINEISDTISKAKEDAINLAKSLKMFVPEDEKWLDVEFGICRGDLNVEREVERDDLDDDRIISNDEPGNEDFVICLNM